MENNQVENCPCPGVKCKAHGQCAICIAKHREAGNVPYCLRKVVEEMVERAVERKIAEN